MQLVRRTYGAKAKRKDAQTGKRSQPKLRRGQNGKVKLLMPREKWVNKLIQLGAIRIKRRRDGKEAFQVMHRGNLCFLPDIVIINQYNAEIRGLYNYYSIANNTDTLSKFGRLMKYSFMKTLAAKYRTRTKVIRNKYEINGNLGVSYETKKGTKRVEFVETSATRKYDAPKGPDLGMDLEINRWSRRNTIKARVDRGTCELCGRKADKLEIHQVKKLKDLSATEDWERTMIRMRRKTLIVCQECHERIHRTCEVNNTGGEPYTPRGVRAVRKGV